MDDWADGLDDERPESFERINLLATHMDDMVRRLEKMAENDSKNREALTEIRRSMANPNHSMRERLSHIAEAMELAGDF